MAGSEHRDMLVPRTRASAEHMKKTDSKKPRVSANRVVASRRKRVALRDELRPHYEFDRKTARPNRFASRFSTNTIAVVLDPDVASVFRDSEAVNQFVSAFRDHCDARNNGAKATPGFVAVAQHSRCTGRRPHRRSPRCATLRVRSAPVSAGRWASESWIHRFSHIGLSGRGPWVRRRRSSMNIGAQPVDRAATRWSSFVANRRLSLRFILQLNGPLIWGPDTHLNSKRR